MNIIKAIEYIKQGCRVRKHNGPEICYKNGRLTLVSKHCGDKSNVTLPMTAAWLEANYEFIHQPHHTHVKSTSYYTGGCV